MMNLLSSGRCVSLSVLALCVIGVQVLSTGCSRSGDSSRIFEDVSLSSGLSYTGITYGGAWGDFDGDDYPDLYFSNHLNEGVLYRNLGDGQFEDVTSSYFSPGSLSGDSHGAAWGDFDNDGDLDLVQLTGAVVGVGSEPKHLFLQEGAQFVDIAASAGVDNPFGRTRMPLWFDVNGDGLLDLFQGSEARFDDMTPPFWFIQEEDAFSEGNNTAVFADRSVPFCIVTQLTDDNAPELVCRVYAKNKSYQVFSTAVLPFNELELLYNTAFWDIAAGDFNGDLAIDLYLARNTPGGPVMLGKRMVNQVIADLKADSDAVANPLGFTFRTDGGINIEVLTDHSGMYFAPRQVHIGAEDIQPEELSFELSPDTRGINGMTSYKDKEESGLYVGMESPGKWRVLLVEAVDRQAGKKQKFDHLSIRVTSTSEISEPEPVGRTVSVSEAPDRRFMNATGEMTEQGDDRGINDSISASVNVVTGDFDNDMDLDLYVVASDEINNHENVLLLNNSDGYFEKAANAGGASGSRLGIGEAVITADYDLDGFLDLLVVNGASMGRSLGLSSDDGGYQLFHNRGNNNHWLEVDLEGTRSNRDGIGATVYLTAGGQTQVRIQDGGIHNRGQNHKRLHFGLGENTRADSVIVHWPSGTVQQLNDVQADQLIQISEPSNATDDGADDTE